MTRHWTDVLFREIVPDKHAKYVYMMAGATIGGVVFALSQSWGWAITYDILTALVCWGMFSVLRFFFS